MSYNNDRNANQMQIDAHFNHPSLLIPIMGIIDAFFTVLLVCFNYFFALLWLYPEQQQVQFLLGSLFILSLR